MERRAVDAGDDNARLRGEVSILQAKLSEAQGETARLRTHPPDAGRRAQ